jgi:signal peptidase II
MALIVSAAILYYYPKVPTGQTPLRLALVLQLGGAVGNLIDRLIQHTVTDFIAIGSFPVFNLADASITLGVAVLAAAIWVEERRGREAAAPAVTVSTSPAASPAVDPPDRPSE